MTPGGLRFGPFSLDAALRELRQDGQVRSLSPKVFDLLVLLVEQRARAVSRAELMAALWPGQVVEEDSLSQLVFALRKALGDERDPRRYVATVPRFGYRFVASVEPAEKTPSAQARGLSAGDAAQAGRGAHWGARGRLVAATVAVALLWALLVVRGRPWPARRAVSEPPLLAVFPFAQLPPGSEPGYLADGLTEGVIDGAARLPGLRVLARTSAFRQRGTHAELQRAARELGADYLLTGELLLEGPGAGLRCDLLAVPSGAPVWGARYALGAAGWGELEERIVRELATRLPRAPAPRAAAVAHRPALDPETYRLYLEGRHFWNRRSAAGLVRSLELFQAALQRDPEYADAQLGLAQAYAVLPEFSRTPEAEAQPRARQAALRALQLDPGLGEAQAVLAFVQFWWERDWVAAEAAFARAHELAPGAATTRQWHGNALLAMGRVEEALECLQEARRLDPVSLIIGTELGAAFYLARRYDEALAELRRVLALEPTFASAHFWLGRALWQRGERERALRAYAEARRLLGTPEAMLAELAYAHARAGRTAVAQHHLAALATHAGTRGVAYGRAIAHLGLGQKAAALALLEDAFTERATDLAYIGTDPIFDDLRPEAAFATLQRRLSTPRARVRESAIAK